MVNDLKITRISISVVKLANIYIYTKGHTKILHQSSMKEK